MIAWLIFVTAQLLFLEKYRSYPRIYHNVHQHEPGRRIYPFWVLWYHVIHHSRCKHHHHWYCCQYGRCGRVSVRMGNVPSPEHSRIMPHRPTTALLADRNRCTDYRWMKWKAENELYEIIAYHSGLDRKIKRRQWPWFLDDGCQTKEYGCNGWGFWSWTHAKSKRTPKH